MIASFLGLSRQKSTPINFFWSDRLFRLKQEEPVGYGRVDGDVQVEVAARVKGVGQDSRPACHGKGNVGGGEHIVICAGQAAAPAQDHVSSGLRNARKLRLGNGSDLQDATGIKAVGVPSQTSPRRSGYDGTE